MADSDPQPTSGGDELDQAVDAFVSSGYQVGGAPGGRDQHGGHGPGEHTEPSVRAFEYRGHQVRIVTHYEITIDGEPWQQSLQVHEDGNVSYHGLPQYLVPSAVDVIQAVIDQRIEAPEEIRTAMRASRETG